MKNDQKVTFRRIRGRIVPIKLKDAASDRNIQKGAGLMAAGVGVTVGAGAAAGALVKEAGARRIRANDLFRIGGGMVKSINRRAASLRAESIQLRAARKPILGIGGLIGGALIGTGAAYLMNSKTLKKRLSDQEKGQLIALGSTGSLLTGLAYYKSLGLDWKGAKAYAGAALQGTTHLLSKIPIKTKLGPLIFK
jgi:hypothetical protein